MLRILTDRGSRKVENHDYLLYLAINDIEHTQTSTNQWHLRAFPQNNFAGVLLGCL